jgi:hypothetical protein
LKHPLPIRERSKFQNLWAKSLTGFRLENGGDWWGNFSSKKQVISALLSVATLVTATI